MLELWVVLLGFALLIASLCLLWLPTKRYKVLVPLVSLCLSAGLYAYWGGWTKLIAQDSQSRILDVLIELHESEVINEQIVAERLQGLEKTLPNDPAILYQMGNVYQRLGWYEKAAQRFEQALDLAPSSKELQLKYAYATALAQQGVLPDNVKQLLNKYLLDQPDDLAAHNLLAMHDYKQGHYQQALKRWRSMLTQAQTKAPEEKDAIMKAIALAKESLPQPDAGIQVKVQLGSQVGHAIEPDTPVFVFAKKQGQVGPPIAVKRVKYSDLPTEVTLTEEDSMQPGVTMESGQDIIVTARIAMQGDPFAKKGDWQGSSTPISLVGLHTISLNINEQIH